MNILKLNITGLTTQGLGIARGTDGKVIMVSNALPGETVSARLTEERKSFSLAQCVEVLTPIPERVTPACPYFGLCGGCDLQHLAYAAQLEVKQTWLKQSLRGLKHVPQMELAGAPREFSYRRRLRPHFSPLHGFGFFAQQSRNLVPVNNCLLAVERINQCWPALQGIKLSGLEQLDLLAGENEIYVQPMGQRLKKQPLSIPGITVYWPQARPDFSQGITYYHKNGLELKAWPGQFCQVNWEVNERLIDLLTNFLRPFVRPGARVLDLFSGSGNLSLPLAGLGARVLAVENNPLACASGTYLAELNRLDCTFIHAPVERFLSGPFERQPDILVLDPPRSGIKKLNISDLRARIICYVSCHPAAMGRDLRVLEDAGYQLARLALLDMFPQTGQMECLSLLIESKP